LVAIFILVYCLIGLTLDLIFHTFHVVSGPTLLTKFSV
jgi:hypothetical protein